MLLLPSFVNRGFVRTFFSPSRKSGIFSLWARVMAEITAKIDTVAKEDAPIGEAAARAANGVVKHSLDEEADGSSSKKLKTITKKEFRNAETVRRKKVAVLLSYCGHGYYGLQINPGMKTIEGDVLSAMLKAGLISQENYEIPQTMQFQRAARTDKGVSAARQILSLRLPLSGDLVDKINAHLPSVIRVMAIKRTTNGFNSKTWCDARTYSYTLPTFALTPIVEKTTEDYRITDDVIERLQSVLQIFKGTHNFHNFTAGRKFEDKSAQRYIMEIESGKPFIDDGLELLTITVKGQSFMLHQIRKIIGITIVIMRDIAPVDVIETAWKAEKVDIPIAPGVGLMLEQVHYDRYNQRYGSDGIHDALDWGELDETIEDFKRNQIRLPLLAAEKQEKSMFLWLSTLPLHTYGSRDDCPMFPANRSQIRSELGRAMVAIENQVGEKSDSNEAKTESLTEKTDAKTECLTEKTDAKTECPAEKTDAKPECPAEKTDAKPECLTEKTDAKTEILTEDPPESATSGVVQQIQ